jgi:glycosyltransferase involved in cell wall biosynthesis
MAAPLAVIATSTGGSSEILVDGENCLVVPRGDPQALADAIRRLLGDPALRRRIAEGAYETVQRFSLEESVDAIERHLQRVSGKT